MEMLRRGGGPAYIPEIPLPPAAALGDVRDEIERMLMPEADMLSFLQPGAKPDEFRMERAEMIPTEELGVPELPARFDLAFDLLRLEDLEKTGLKSFVIVDPEDRRNIVGYFHVTRTRGMGGMDLTQLAENMSRRTGLRVQAEDHWVGLRSPEILKAPLLFLGSPGRIEYDESGRRREPLGVGVDTLKFVEGVEKQDIEFLAEYLLKGGFLVLPKMELYDQLKRHLQEAHPQRFAFFSLPVDHDLFHSYYDIDPESLNELFRSINLRDEAAARRLPSWFQGIGLEGRLVVVAPIRVPRWVPPLDTQEDSPREDSPRIPPDYIPMTRFCVNLIAYALTQPGGIGYTVFREPRPERSYEGEPDAYLAILRSPNTESLDLARTRVFLNDEKLYEREESDERGDYDGMLFHPLTGGKHTVRIEYEGKAAEVDLVLRGHRVTTLTVGSTRFLWMTRIWAEVTGEDEAYPAWQSRTAFLRIWDVEASAKPAGGSERHAKGR